MHCFSNKNRQALRGSPP